MYVLVLDQNFALTSEKPPLIFSLCLKLSCVSYCNFFFLLLSISAKVSSVPQMTHSSHMTHGQKSGNQPRSLTHCCAGCCIPVLLCMVRRLFSLINPLFS